MLLSISFFICVALNTSLIGFYLLPPLLAAISDLRFGFERSRRYLTCRLSETREKALRQRTLILLRRLTVGIAYLAGIALCYIPSMWFAHYQSSLSGAFFSTEALAGMLAGAVVVGLRKRRI